MMSENGESQLAVHVRVGAKLWPITYGAGLDDIASYAEITKYYASQPWAQGSEFWENSELTEHRCLKPEISLGTLWSTKWIDTACRMIEASDEKYFAAMAATKIDPEAGRNIRCPWPVFAMRLPNGFLVGADGSTYDVARFGQFDTIHLTRGRCTTAYMAISPKETGLPEIMHWYPGCTLNDLLFIRAGTLPDHGLVKLDRSEKQIQDVVSSACAGLLYTLQHTKNHTFGGYFNKPHHIRTPGPPAHRIIKVGRPLVVDVRAGIRDAIMGRGASPKVQTLVRGHIRNQVCGPRNSLRKPIWIEPFWRGPEDAPIMTRPYRTPDVS